MHRLIVLVKWVTVRLLLGGLVKAFSVAPIATFQRIRVNKDAARKVAIPITRIDTYIRHRLVSVQDTRVQATESDEEGVVKKKSGRHPCEFMTVPDGSKIAYTQVYNEGANEIVIFLPNLSDKRDCRSATEVEEHCVKEGYHFFCADWYSRGDSCGEVMDATLTRWTSDIIRLLDECAPSVEGGTGGTKAILVGAGVGVWVAVLVAMQRPDLARGLVGIGGDPDFTEDLLWKELPEEIKDEIMTKGVKEVTWGRLNAVYPITRSLIEDGRKNLVLRGGPGSLPIKCPVRLIHSINDEEVPVETSTKLAECVESQNCVISMPKVALKVPAINRAIEQCVEFTNI